MLIKIKCNEQKLKIKYNKPKIGVGPTHTQINTHQLKKSPQYQST